MTLAQRQQRLLAILVVFAILCLLLLSFTAFEVIQHMNGIWHIAHGFAMAGPNFRSRHP